MKQSTLCVLSLIGGAAIGATIALAFAPKTGKEMRGLVHDFLTDEYNKWVGHKDAATACDCDKK
ncbi:MAG: YtxH domain-containing protein [Alistipes sp.]|nr:YtxH domain-containing protein [Alistipes sp.]